MKRHGKHKKVNKNKWVVVARFLCIICLLIGISYIAYESYYKCKDKKDNEEVQNAIQETETESNIKSNKMIELEKLHAENPDIIGWLEIENTNINYPVLQADNNEYYLAHNYKKEYSKSGSLFLDKDFDFDRPSTNYLIYGHRNIQGLMFEDLINYKKEDYYKQHPIIKFTTLTEDCEYEIIAVFLSKVYYKSDKNVFRYYFFVNAENEKEYNEYIENCKNVSIYDTGKTAEYGDQLLTLSTCEYSQKDGRLAVVARKMKN